MLLSTSSGLFVAHSDFRHFIILTYSPRPDLCAVEISAPPALAILSAAIHNVVPHRFDAAISFSTVLIPRPRFGRLMLRLKASGSFAFTATRRYAITLEL